MLNTSTTDELLTARAISFPSVVNFFILLKETRSDMSTSRGKQRSVITKSGDVFYSTSFLVKQPASSRFTEKFLPSKFKYT